MGKKRRLEIEHRLPGQDAPESQYDKAARRLELHTEEGAEHPGFSVKENCVEIDISCVEKHRQRLEEERTQRMGRLRVIYEEENRKVNELLSPTPPEPTVLAAENLAEQTGKVLLNGIFVLCGVRALFELRGWIASRPDSEFLPYLVLSLTALGIRTLGRLSARTLRIGARAAYAAFLIYFGAAGALRLLNLFWSPPVRGVDWDRFGWSITSAAMLFILVSLAASYLRWSWRIRGEIFSALDGPEPFVSRYPMFQNRELMRSAVYLIEASYCVLLVLAACILVFGIDPLTLFSACWNEPALPLLALYPGLVWFGFRCTFYPIT